MTNKGSIESLKPAQLAAESIVFVAYLEQFGLPTENIIATTEERGVIAANLPSFLSTLPSDVKKDAFYLSKFVGATAIGLFDAALNYVWNEVVLCLRKNAIIYGVDLFFDAAVGGKNRESFKIEDDLSGLKDTVLLESCRKLELISDIVFIKLDNILTMRNELAASHPNAESIGGFELLGWLQTCVKEVLQEKPSESAIKIKALVNNLRTTSEVIANSSLTRLQAELKNLSPAHVNNLLMTTFGMFVDPNSGQVLRKNIAEISPTIWQFSSDNIKYKIGVTIDSYRTNLHQGKLEKGVEFLKLVGGLMYESLPSRNIALQKLADDLEDAHNGRDNYYHEPSIMKDILQYFRSSADIPQAALSSLVQIVLRCRLGRGLSYRRGVSPSGLPLYDQFFGLLDDEGITECIATLFKPELNSKLRNQTCQEHLLDVLQILEQIAISERLKQALHYLASDVKNAHKANIRREFRELMDPILQWPLDN
jgi:hypothetical protein